MNNVLQSKKVLNITNRIDSLSSPAYVKTEDLTKFTSFMDYETMTIR